MRFCRGDVVIINHPYSDASGAKVRPVLIVQSDRDNVRLNNTIVAMISRTIHRYNEPTQLLIEVPSPEGKQAGLLATSVVNCSSLFTVHEQLIRKRIGRLSEPALQLVGKCLAAALGIE